jgi:hypothetical protein
MLNGTSFDGNPPRKTRRGPLDVGQPPIAAEAVSYDRILLPSREDAVEIDNSSKSTLVMHGPEGVMAQVEAQLRSIAVVVEDVISTSTPTLALLEVSRAIQMALVSLNQWRSV